MIADDDERTSDLDSAAEQAIERAEASWAQREAELRERWREREAQQVAEGEHRRKEDMADWERQTIERQRRALESLQMEADELRRRIDRLERLTSSLREAELADNPLSRLARWWHSLLRRSS